MGQQKQISLQFEKWGKKIQSFFFGKFRSICNLNFDR